MRTARWIFRVAGIYGLLVLLPQYFLLDRINTENPPAVTHVEYFYGFVGLALVWQVAFLLIATDPIRYRWFMLIAIFEKLSFAIPAAILFAQTRITPGVFAFGMIDLTLAICFSVAFALTKQRLVEADARTN